MQNGTTQLLFYVQLLLYVVGSFRLGQMFPDVYVCCNLESHTAVRASRSRRCRASLSHLHIAAPSVATAAISVPYRSTLLISWAAFALRECAIAQHRRQYLRCRRRSHPPAHTALAARGSGFPGPAHRGHTSHTPNLAEALKLFSHGWGRHGGSHRLADGRHVVFKGILHKYQPSQLFTS